MKVVQLNSTPSTNSWALEQAAVLDCAHSYAIWTTKQTAGRGQRGRKWESEEGKSLTASYAFFTKHPRATLSPIGLITCLSLRKALLRWPFSELKIKWPNDLFVKGKKLGGVLVETKEVDQNLFVVIGIGINLLQDDLSAINRPATSLFLETGHTPPIEKVLQEVLQNLQKDLCLFLKEGFTPFQKEYNAHLLQNLYCYTQANGAILNGKIGLVDEEGRLFFLPEKGEPCFLVSGELLPLAEEAILKH